jgi:ADP-L-glycero-D-manno-heptose 6-epimerase
MIIVTGGAGFIGSNLLAKLEEKGLTNLVVCDYLGTEDKWRNIAKRELRDIVHPDNLLHYMDKHDGEIQAVFHMGAISATTERDADLIIQTNFTLSRKLWKWCAEHDVRFVYASSAATYGDGNQGFKDAETPEHLKTLQPLNPYGWSKHLFDRRTCRIVHDTKHGDEKLPPQWAGLKFFNVYGPNEYHKGDMMSVACKLYPQITAGAAAKLFRSPNPKYEDGGQMRDFVFVDDCVNVMMWLYDNPKVNGLFNVGSGKARSFKDLASSCFKALGHEPRINYMDMPQELHAKYQYFTQADISKLRAAGYTKPMTELEEGVRIYMQDYLSREDQYR